jgi:uncharacterized phage protein (TIGR02220 family)
LAKLPAQYLDGKLTTKKLAVELRAIADWIDPEGEFRPVEKQPSTTPEEREVFAYWQRAVGKPEAKFTADRRAKIRARLREGYSVDDIKKAIRNVAESTYHRGENANGHEYCDLTLICRNGSKLEGYRDIAGGIEPAPKVLESGTEGRIQQLQRDAAALLAEGKIDAYNQTQSEIRRLRSARG